MSERETKKGPLATLKAAVSESGPARQYAHTKRDLQSRGLGAKREASTHGQRTADDSSPVSAYLRETLRHYNAGTAMRAADGWIDLLERGGTMFVSLAGAASTAELGRVLAPAIRAGAIGGISATGANLEESVFNLVGRHDYVPLEDYHDTTPKDDANLRDEGLNRVTDTAIPDEKVIEPVTKEMLRLWQEAEAKGERYYPHEYLWQLLRSGALEKHYQDDPENCWLLAAMEQNIPIVTPGWEDSTLGNEFAGAVAKGELRGYDCVQTGVEWFNDLAGWYEKTSAKREIGFFQCGGGIAGDGPICVVPYLRTTMKKEVPYWAYFCQITDADESYGGYSGALPTEKVTWEKLDENGPKFNVKSDMTIVLPLILAVVLHR